MRVGRHVIEETPDALLQRLEATAVADKTAEVRKKRSLIGCVVTVLGGIGLLFLLAFLQALWPVLEPAFGPFVMAWFGIGLTGSLVLRVMSAGRDLDDRKLHTLVKLVRILRSDLPVSDPVCLEVDFRSYQKGRRVSREGGFFSSVKTFGYEHPWLRLQAGLADGTRIVISMTDHVKRKQKSKRKYTKVRERLTGEISLALRLARVHGDAGEVSQRLGQIPPPAGLTMRGVRGRSRTLVATVATPPARRVVGRRGDSGPLGRPEADNVLLALRWVYRALSPASVGGSTRTA